MRHIKQIMIAAALSVLVIFAGISISNASQTGVKGKHKHTLSKHKVKGKHHQSSVQTLGNVEMKEELEMRCSPNQSNQWFEHHKDLATGTIPTGLTHSWHEHDLMMEYSGSASPLSSPLDTVMSIGPFQASHGISSSGRTRAILVSTADATDKTFFAGGVGGGLWKTTNGGAYWSPVNDQAENLSVMCITQSPFTSNNIYYGTGEPPGFVDNHSPQAIPGDGVFKSTDGGNTFTHVTPSNFPNYIWSIAHSARDANTVYVGTDANGLWSTTDGGSTWNNLNVAGSTGGTVGDILTFPSGYGVGAVLISKNDDGLYYSPTGASGTFTKISSSAFPTTYFQEVKLANCNSTPNVVYAAFTPYTWTGDSLERFDKSTDGGATWDSLKIPSIGGTYDDYTIMLGVNPNNSNEVICGGTNWFYSNDGGADWNGSNYVHDQHGYAYFNHSHNFLITDDGGVKQGSFDTMFTYRNGINFTPWWLDSNFATLQFWGGDFASSLRRCLGFTQDNGLWRFSPDLDTAVGLGTSFSSEGFSAHISQQDSNLGYWYDAHGQIGGTTNLFARNSAPSWLTISSGFGGQGRNAYNFFQINYADGAQLYFPTYGGVWRTTDEGSDWTQLNTYNIQGIQFIGCTNVANPTLYFTTHGVAPRDSFYRISSAKTFTPGIPTNLSASIPSVVDTASFGEITVYPSTGPTTTLFMCTTNYSSIPHIYKVTGANGSSPSWTDITGDMHTNYPTLAVNEVQSDPAKPNDIFAATDYGLYYTTNGGTNWLKETRVPNVMINEMQLRSSDHKLFLFTQGRGAWYCSINASTPGNVQQASVSPTLTAPQLQFSLYPNPATEKLTINPQQTLSSSARIAIYSSDGRMISESAWNPTGGNGQEINIGSLPSGVYFLQITDGNTIAKKKFVKM